MHTRPLVPKSGDGVFTEVEMTRILFAAGALAVAVALNSAAASAAPNAGQAAPPSAAPATYPGYHPPWHYEWRYRYDQHNRYKPGWVAVLNSIG
jgi:hypothetical protein